MGKVVLLVNVELTPEKREEYIQFTSQLKTRFEGNPKLQYSAFENQGKDAKNHFTEMFTFDSMESYEAFEEEDDEAAKDLSAKIIGLSSRTKYSTFIEVA
jgi:antibiotic biosynthesis monooxygenase (ABM) superfamily enzyme